MQFVYVLIRKEKIIDREPEPIMLTYMATAYYKYMHGLSQIQQFIITASGPVSRSQWLYRHALKREIKFVATICTVTVKQRK